MLDCSTNLIVYRLFLHFVLASISLRSGHLVDNVTIGAEK
jgi:hypothetical protein